MCSTIPIPCSYSWAAGQSRSRTPPWRDRGTVSILVEGNAYRPRRIRLKVQAVAEHSRDLVEYLLSCGQSHWSGRAREDEFEGDRFPRLTSVTSRTIWLCHSTIRVRRARGKMPSSCGEGRKKEMGVSWSTESFGIPHGRESCEETAGVQRAKVVKM